LKQVKPIEQPAFAIPNVIGISPLNEELLELSGQPLTELCAVGQSNTQASAEMLKNTSCLSELTQWRLLAVLVTSFEATLHHLATLGAPLVVSVTAT